jgi:hypothetical protein
MDKEHILLMTEINIKDYLIMVILMVKELVLIKKDINIKVSGKKAINKEQEYIS